MSPDTPSRDLQEKTLAWLRERGLPLEYRTAHKLAQHGFGVWQSYYVATDDPAHPREIDVLAGYGPIEGDDPRQFSLCVECKWSKASPWIVFTSEHAQLASSRAVRSVIGNPTADAILWLLQDEPRLHALTQLRSPLRPGFGGRVGLLRSEDRDPFYACMQATVDKTRAYVGADSTDRAARRGLNNAHFGFPMVVVDGDVFEASYDANADDVSLTAVASTRLHWRGHHATRYGSHVDIVVAERLEEYLVDWRRDIACFEEVVADVHRRIVQASSSGSRLPAELFRGRDTSPPILVPPAIRHLIPPML